MVKVYRKMLYFSTFFGQRPKRSSKVLFKFVFFMMPSVYMLGNQIKNIKMRSSKFIIENITQKVMAKSSFGCRFHDLKCFCFFHIP